MSKIFAKEQSMPGCCCRLIRSFERILFASPMYDSSSTNGRGCNLFCSKANYQRVLCDQIWGYWQIVLVGFKETSCCVLDFCDVVSDEWKVHVWISIWNVLNNRICKIKQIMINDGSKFRNPLWWVLVFAFLSWWVQKRWRECYGGGGKKRKDGTEINANSWKVDFANNAFVNRPVGCIYFSRHF